MSRLATFLCLCSFAIFPGVLSAHARDAVDLWSNTHVSAGHTVTMVSGGDMNLIGAVVSGHQIIADVGSGYGGNLNIESLQNKSTYDSDQESSGFNISLGFNLNAFGGSVTAGQRQIESDYASVTETSGIKAGDGGFTVTVKGDTSLIGAVIASTEQAVQENKNSFETGGTLTLTNLENHADYEASGSSVTVGGSYGPDAQGNNPLKPSGNAGMGEDEGHDSSTTEAGISGIVGKEAVRTGDAETGIKNTFDKDKVQKEIDAQIAITQSFGQQASKAVGDYAQSQTDKASKLRLEAAQLNDADPRAAELIAQAQELESQWGENGTLRIAAHTVIGGLTGGTNGALGSLVGTLTASQAAQMLRESGITQESNPVLYNSLVALASTAAGALVGGEMGAGTAFNEVANNLLMHDQPKKFAARFAACDQSENPQQCRRETISAIQQASQENEEALDKCLQSGDVACRQNFEQGIAEAASGFKDMSGLIDPAISKAWDLENERISDILTNCGVGSSLLACGVKQWAARGLLDIAYAAIGGVSLTKPGAGVFEKEVAGSGVKGNTTAGAVADANFAQSTIRSSEIFSADGIINYSELAGRPISTVDDLVGALRDGSIKASQIPVGYVVTSDGTKLILNTRTSVALDRAGIPKSEWYGMNQTGVPVPNPSNNLNLAGKTFDDLAADQLKNNKLPPTGTPDIPKGKK